MQINARSATITDPVPHIDDSSFKFSFDHRLSPKDDVRTYLPFLNYLQRHTGLSFSLRFTESYEDNVDNLGRGLVQFAAMGPVNAIIAQKKYGAGCLVMGLNKDSKPEYRSVIVAGVETSINSLADLAGKSFAFGDQYSTQGHVIAKKMLEDAGIALQDLRGHVFTGSHANTARAVLNGNYDAGAIQDTLAEKLAMEGKIKIIKVSNPYPSSLICHVKSVDPEVLKTVKNALLDMDPTGVHRELLVGWGRTEMPHGFTEFHQESLDEIAVLVDRYLLNPSKDNR
ncbi:MAG: phosphate/phosphite/phosphonate ABC transporter substrate-binding protein [Desulfobulbaceae bacterium]|nr:phosphate/phosphite/phosphonate ABC transporter substrate-binding protein [Desulfobulbaceae bacterium]